MLLSLRTLSVLNAREASTALQSGILEQGCCGAEGLLAGRLRARSTS